MADSIGSRSWAPNQIEAEIAVELLTREGIPARIKPSDSLPFLAVSSRR